MKEDNRCKELAEFLIAKRNQIQPSEVGLKSLGHRKTPGLRREEVASLAGIGVTWYTWLEQSRDVQLSQKAATNLADALLLDAKERRHFFTLANVPSPVEEYEQTKKINPLLKHFLDSLEFSPALIVDQMQNILAWNKAAVVLYGDFTKMTDRERNIVWAMFTQERFKNMYPEWKKHAEDLAGILRAASAKYIGNEYFANFINALCSESPEFEQIWRKNKISIENEVHKFLIHPNLGELSFEVCTFDVPDDEILKLIVHTPLEEYDTINKMKKASASV